MSKNVTSKKVWRLCDHITKRNTLFSHYSPETIDLFIHYLREDIDEEFKDNPEIREKIQNIIDNRYYSQKQE